MKIEVTHPQSGEIVGVAEITDGETLVGLMTGYVTDREKNDPRRMDEIGASMFIAGLSEADVMTLPSRWFLLVPIIRKES